VDPNDVGDCFHGAPAFAPLGARGWPKYLYAYSFM
jgi:hypothetical protein